jgi:hypothetical protein
MIFCVSARMAQQLVCCPVKGITVQLLNTHSGISLSQLGCPPTESPGSCRSHYATRSLPLRTFNVSFGSCGWSYTNRRESEPPRFLISMTYSAENERPGTAAVTVVLAGFLSTYLRCAPVYPVIEAANSRWRDAKPAIFGILLERALDPNERHALGAHYAPRAYVERLIIPTLVGPLREDWRVT